jgi:hypothetical protein
MRTNPIVSVKRMSIVGDADRNQLTQFISERTSGGRNP